MLSVIYLSLVTVLSTVALSSHAATSLEHYRSQYSEALEALKRGRNTDYQRLRSSLDDYPLAIYLDYQDLRRNLASLQLSQAQDFLRASEGSPLYLRFLSAYLDQLGKQRQWQSFLSVMPQEPNSIELKCYYFRARLASGAKDVAWEGAERLWVYGRSRPKVCDPLFDAWIKDGGLDDRIVWTRMLNAFDTRQSSLMRYVGRKSSEALRPWSDKLQQVYAHPERMRQLSLSAKSAYASDIVSHGLAYLARYNQAMAIRYWQQYQSELSFSLPQQRKIEAAIVRHSLFAKTVDNLDWVDQALARLKQDDLVEIRLRLALSKQDWAVVAQMLPLLSEQVRDASVWRYWQAYVWEQQGEKALAHQAYSALAKERDYYGFLAADRLGLAYSFNNSSVALSDFERDKLLSSAAVQRIVELRFHEQISNAHSEWYQLTLATENDYLLSLAVLAQSQGWHRMAIDAANRAKAWDALALRFPMPYEETFMRYAAQRKVAGSELLAIARRESAFYPQARSPVGARGLMQIMPATGREVAKSLGVAHRDTALYEVEHNVLLGSEYYRRLLERFDGNRIFALAAYNAGPSRVDLWRRSRAKIAVPAEVWVETIPYRETRNYVQAVLAYNAVFRHQRGEQPGPLLNASEGGLSY